MRDRGREIAAFLFLPLLFAALISLSPWIKHEYLLFHSLTEIAAATISFSTFLFTWNTRRFQNSFLLIVGISALFVGCFEMLHCLAFPGMSVFPHYDDNLSPQLWLAARGFQAASFMLGAALIHRLLKSASLLLMGFIVAFGLVCSAVFLRVMPNVVVAAGGLTTFKIASECLIAGIFIASMAMLYRAKSRFSDRVFRYVMLNGLFMVATDICFTLYSDPYDFLNFLGHVLLICGVYCQYRAVLQTGLTNPTAVHFHDLARAHQESERTRAFLKESEERLELALEAGRSATWEVDPAKPVIEVSRGHGRIYGQEENFPTWTLDTFYSRIEPEDRGRVEQIIRDVFEGRLNSYSVEFRTTWPDGSLHWLNSTAHVTRDAGGRLLRLRGLITDVTRAKEVEAALQQAIQLREDLVAVVSHDLRTPLAAIKLSKDVLQRGLQSGMAREMLIRIVERLNYPIEQAEQLIANQLDIATIESGKLSLSVDRQNPVDLVADAVRGVAALAENKNISIETEAPTQGKYVLCDKARIRQVFANLLSNAVKFTPEGGRVRLGYAADDSEFRFFVEDDGPGIEPGLAPHVFDRFRQGKRNDRRGTGLGLAIAKGIVEAHGGRIWVESPAKGSIFLFTLPIAAERATN